MRKTLATLAILAASICSAYTNTVLVSTNTRAATEKWVSVRFEATLPSTPTNPASKFLNGNREWTAVSIGAGGYGGNLYLIPEESTNAGYYRISYDAGLTESNIVATVNAGTNELGKYLFDDPIGITIIDGGMWVSSFRAGVDKSAGASRLMMTVFVYQTNGTERVLFSVSSDEIDNNELTFVKKETTQPVFEVNTNDRLGVIISAIATVPAVTFTTTVGDGNGSYFTTPLRIRHTQLRDYNGDVDYQHITTGQVSKLDYISDNGITRINDSAQPSRYFMEIVNGTGTVYEVSGPFTNLMVTLSDDFEETATHSRPAWTTNAFPFTDGSWYTSVTEGYVIAFGSEEAYWHSETLDVPAILAPYYNAQGTATVSVASVYYTTNAIKHFSTEAELEAAKAECGVVLTNTVNEAVSNLTADITSATNALMPYARTVYGDVSTTNEAGYAAFNATNAGAASYSVLIPSSAVGSFTNTFRYYLNDVRKTGVLTNKAWFVVSGLGSGYKSTATLVSLKDVTGNTLASSYSQGAYLRLIGENTCVTNALTIPLNVYSGTVEVACVSVSTNVSNSVLLYTGGQYASSLSFGEAPIPYATVSDLSGLRLGGATNITDGVTSGTFIEATRTIDISAITGKAITNSSTFVADTGTGSTIFGTYGKAFSDGGEMTLGHKNISNFSNFAFTQNSLGTTVFNGYDVHFRIGNVSKMYIAHNGNIGVGTGYDVFNSPTSPFTVTVDSSFTKPLSIGPIISGKQATLFSNGTNLWFVNVNSVTNALTTN